MNMDAQADRIAFALIKIAAYVRRPELRRRIEESAFNLIEMVAKRDIQRFFEAIPATEALVRVGKTIYEIEPMNADMLISEIGNLKSEIRQIAELSLPPKYEQVFNSVQLQNLWNSSQQTGFRKIEEDIKNYRFRPEISKIHSETIMAKTDSQKPKSQEIIEERNKEDKEENGTKSEGILSTSLTLDNPAMRQSAIADKIRKFGNKTAQLKDIVAEFSNVSERTLRYDLERLCNQGVIERIGQGGPGTYYRARVI
ncbi:MAG: DeoR family transcriptional regulator [Patescibacteria group bacterium]